MHTGELQSCDDLDEIEDDDEEIDDGDSGNASVVADTKNKTPVELILRNAESAQFFKTEQGKLCAAVPVNGRTEHLRIGSKPFELWLTHGFYIEHKRIPPKEAIHAAITQLEAKAMFEGPEATLFVRVAEHQGSCFIDLANDARQVVQVDQSGWRIIDDPPVAFWRPNALEPLPEPKRGGSLDPLHPLVNLSSDADWLIFVALLTSYFRHSGPFPLMVLLGEQGCAKSTTARIVKRLIDPNAVPLKSQPRNIEDGAIAAQNTWVMVMDNISRLPSWLSDWLCVLSTGGGISKRELYANEGETIIGFKRPVVLNGITEIVERGDLADRCVFLHLPVIPEDKRRSEADVNAAIELALPGALGALLDVIVAALKLLPGIKPPRLPRMADFGLWGEAVGQAMGKPPGEFIAVYAGNRKDATSVILDVDPVAVQIQALMKSQDHWEGTCTALLKALAKLGGDDLKRQTDWPKTAKGLRERLKRLAPALRSNGFDFTFGDRTGVGRKTSLIHIRRVVPLGLDNQPKDEPCEAPARLVEQSPPISSDPTQPVHGGYYGSVEPTQPVRGGSSYYGSGGQGDSYSSQLARLSKSSRPADDADDEYDIRC